MHKNGTEMKNGPIESYKNKKYTCTKQDTNYWKQMTVHVYGTESFKE